MNRQKMKWFYSFVAVAALLALPACAEKEDKVVPEPAAAPSVASVQSKYYMTAEEDLDGKVIEGVAGLKVKLWDSKFYAAGERVLSVRYESDGRISGTAGEEDPADGASFVEMKWESPDPVNRPAVGHAPDCAEFGLLCLPGVFNGKFIVKTDRYDYEFTKSISLGSGAVVEVTLDFASPDVQPVRKVGILGDSISTFEGALCDEDYSPYYPENDPNVGVNPELAVDCKEKTYWWRVIYDYMKHGTLDVNNSWSGSKVVHELKTGRVSGRSVPAGFVDRAYAFVDPDIILIHGGTNDHNHSTPTGTYDWDYPIGQYDLLSYRSAYIQLVKMLQHRYEGVQIIIIIGDRLSTDYEESTKTIAEHFGLPYVNFVGDEIEKCKGSHPTAPAFEQMAAKIYETCKDYLP